MMMTPVSSILGEDTRLSTYAEPDNAEVVACAMRIEPCVHVSYRLRGILLLAVEYPL